MIGALLSLLRRVPVAGADGIGRRARARRRDHRPGRHGAGGALDRPAARRLRLAHPRLRPGAACERPVVGPLARQPCRPARDARARPTCVCVQLDYFSRYHGLLGERFLPSCKPNQVRRQHRAFAPVRRSSRWPTALKSGRIAAAWLDSVEPGALDPHRPLHGIETLQITPRVASTTRESRLRSAWAVARRIDELLEAPTSAPADFKSTSQARSLILKPIRCRREVGDALLLLIDHRRRRARDEALVGELGRSPWRSRRRGARSPCSRRARLGGARRSRRAAPAAVAPTTATGESLDGLRERSRRRRTPSLPTGCASAFSSGVASRTKSASPIACSGTRSPGDRFISLRRLRQAADDRLQLARPRRRPSASTRSSCAFG